MRKISFTPDTFKEYNHWITEDTEIVQKIIALLRDIQNDPLKGIGKPEPLKRDYSGYWSRRITQEHRLIYRVNNDYIEIIKCIGHY